MASEKTDKIKLNHNCIICDKEIFLGQDFASVNMCPAHLECHNREIRNKAKKEEIKWLEDEFMTKVSFLDHECIISKRLKELKSEEDNA